MYIAFRWLLGLCFTLWIAMCCVDVFIKKSKNIRGTGFHLEPFGFLFKNISSPIERKSHIKKQRINHMYDKKHSMALLHSFMFLAGALAVLVFNKKEEIILFTKSNISKINVGPIILKISLYLKRTALNKLVATLKYSMILWEMWKRLIVKLRNKIVLIEKHGNYQKNNFTLLKKLRDVGEERKNLGQLLIAAIHENKNIRMQYERETMAKSRLERHIEDTQKQMKENRSRYVNFQHLYLVTHQENIFLRARIKKLTKEKDDTEKSLMGLMSEVYKSKNNELKAFCSRFMMKTKENLIHSDVEEEIDKFLGNSRNQQPITNTSRCQLSEKSDIEVNTAQSWPNCTRIGITEIIQEDSNLVPLVSDAPKLKGLPGENVWTVKDKDGIIEKLYEYDYASGFDNGDTIRRIRQYSVYFDKDCLLDFSDSRTIIKTINPHKSSSRREYVNVEYPVTDGKFLTGSEAFRKFLQSNKNVISSSRSPALSIL